MAPSRNSTLVTKPPTRARTCTSSIGSKRPVNSSQSVTVRLVGCATGTGGGAAAARCCGLFPQPESVSANTKPNRDKGGGGKEPRLPPLAQPPQCPNQPKTN